MWKKSTGCLACSGLPARVGMLAAAIGMRAQRHMAWGESACIWHGASQMHMGWGESACPSQLRLSAVLQASCTPTVESGIIQLLKLQDPLLVKGGFNRPNMQYTVRTLPGTDPRAAVQAQQGVAASTALAACTSMQSSCAATSPHCCAGDMQRRTAARAHQAQHRALCQQQQCWLC